MLAKNAGFCGGIARAVRLIEKAFENGERLCFLGPPLHNPQLLESLLERGGRVIADIGEVTRGETVVLRSHGTDKETVDLLLEKNIPFIDTVCPHVQKTFEIVQSNNGAAVLILGKAGHPEVSAIASRCRGGAVVIKNAGELKTVKAEAGDSVEKNYIFVAQSTSKLAEWQKCVETTKKEWTNLILFGTICNATEVRQNEAEELSRRCDITVVAGGRGSSNTAALYDICRRNGPAVLVEKARELSPHMFAGVRTAGLVAGASTPAFIIKEVLKTMSDIANVQDEMSFEEMLEQSFKTVYTKEKVTGIVTSVSQNEIAVDIGTKHAGYIPFHEFTDDPGAKLDELVSVGDELELIVLRVNDVEGTAMLSKKRLDAIAGYEKVLEAEKSGEILTGTVVDVVKGGLIALSSGVRVFIPASQATVSREQSLNLEPLLKTQVQFRILETNEKRRRAVGSIRAVLRDQRKGLEEQFWNGAEIGKSYIGTVKSITSYGVFVDLGGVDGMVHISELSWKRIKDPSEAVSIGQKLEVTIKDIDRESRKISLGYKKSEDNPWDVLQKQYAAGDTARVKIVSITTFGAFAQVIPGVDGLIHISQISTDRIGKPSDVLSVGQEVDVKITDIDLAKKRVSLSIRAFLVEQGSRAEDAEDEPVSMEFGPPDAKPLTHKGQPNGEDTPQEVELLAEAEANIREV
ncbi:MAG: bifunctional 4-hydroxy-3-methylbut-2-enyl diphosphate reductase/30S ribosomal protein S1 [Oscillospiraceae bacterium]|jgi:4-hydroxy-3-methylbut-2-enyl diphosphate reductase|nr:bifunctional 4-hydroxy-3-methylbut-2-enyl diphosphate reductase/30S ribosomal protein S1 [Oscillospiraceae bacterium]